MGNRILLIVCMLMLLGNSFGRQDTKNSVSEEKAINVCCTPEMHKMAETFVREYSRLNGHLNFTLQRVTPDQFAGELNRKNSVGFIAENDVSIQSDNLWRMLIARHIILPVTSAENPELEKLEKKGILAKELRESIRNKSGEAVNICVLEDVAAENCLAGFLGTDALNAAKTVKVNTKEELIQKLKSDKTAIGFCCFLYMAEDSENEFTTDFKILPVDKNENGRADYHEQIYRQLTEAEKNSGNLSAHEMAFGSLDAFKRGVWIGKYPRSLVNELYMVAVNLPEDKEVSEFISWAVTGGQQFINGSDYSQLVYAERQSKLNDLQPAEIIAQQPGQDRAVSKLILYIVLAVIAVSLIVGFVTNYQKRKAKGLLTVLPGNINVLNEENVKIPGGVYFDKTHTWSFMEKNGMVKVGIDDFMQQVTGEFTSIKMKNPGERIMKNEPLVILVQDGKQIEISAPVSGVIKDINEDLVTDPAEINKSPYSDGWIYEIEPSNWQREISFMKMADSYKDWIKKEFIRLKDFLAVVVNADVEKQIAFQEGGELVVNVLRELGPRVWEDFQKKFIDTSDLN